MGVSALPNTQKKANQLKDLMAKHLPRSKAIKSLSYIFADDSMYDDIDKQDKNEDVRHIIAFYLKDIMDEPLSSFTKPWEPEAVIICQKIIEDSNTGIVHAKNWSVPYTKAKAEKIKTLLQNKVSQAEAKENLPGIMHNDFLMNAIGFMLPGHDARPLIRMALLVTMNHVNQKLEGWEPEAVAICNQILEEEKAKGQAFWG